MIGHLKHRVEHWICSREKKSSFGEGVVSVLQTHSPDADPQDEPSA
jgi:hypothetical protein